MTDGKVTEALPQMSQDIDTKAQIIMAQAKREVVP